MRNKGFTLIELLVVVLIIGILAAIALPQYQVAVKKTQLGTYMEMVHSLRKAEEFYFLAHGDYTDDITALDIDMPTGAGCVLYKDSYCSVYECGDKWYGICNGASNAQAGTKEFTAYKLRYLQVFKDFSHDGVNLYKGDIVCMARKPVEKRACQSIGPNEMIYGGTDGESWYRYTK